MRGYAETRRACARIEAAALGLGCEGNRMVGQIEQARERVLARINATPKVGQLPQGNNSFANPYRPNFLAGCCDKGQNTTAPAYVLRP